MTRIQDAVALQSPFAKVFPKPVVSRRSPTVKDKKYELGQRWLNTKTNQSWTLTSVFGGRAEWDLNSVDLGNVSLIFGQSPIMQTRVTTGGPPTGVATDVNLMHLQKGVAMEQFLISAQTIIAPRMNVVGLPVNLDLDIGKGVEYNFGADRETSVPSFIIGTSPAFFFEVGIIIDKPEEADPYLIGFRKVQDNEQVFTNYTDYATIGMSKSFSTTNIVTRISLNGSETDTVTNSLWGPMETFKLLRVSVSGSGVVTYTVDGQPPLPPVGSVTFDSGDVMCPFMHFDHGVGPGFILLNSMKYGFQA